MRMTSAMSVYASGPGLPDPGVLGGRGVLPLPKGLLGNWNELMDELYSGGGWRSVF